MYLGTTITVLFTLYGTFYAIIVNLMCIACVILSQHENGT